MDKLEVIDIDAATFRYPEEIISAFRSIADPFEN